MYVMYIYTGVCMYYVCMCVFNPMQLNLSQSTDEATFPSPHHRSQHNPPICHILCQLYQMHTVSPHFFRSTLMLSYHLNIDFPNVPFVSEFTNKIFSVLFHTITEACLYCTMHAMRYRPYCAL